MNHHSQSRLEALLATGRLPVRRQMSQSFADELGREVIKSFPPGAKLPLENELAERYRVSRTVVREGVRLLVAKGIIEVSPRRGTIVRPKADWDLLDEDVAIWRYEAGLEAEDLKELLVFRQAFEPSVAAMAAQVATQDGIQSIRRAYGGMEDSTSDIQAFVAADAQFHISIIDSCRNQFISCLRDMISAGLLYSIEHTNRTQTQNLASLKLHEDVCLAIEGRSPAAARRAMETLLEDTQHRLAKNMSWSAG